MCFHCHFLHYTTEFLLLDVLWELQAPPLVSPMAFRTDRAIQYRLHLFSFSLFSVYSDCEMIISLQLPMVWVLMVVLMLAVFMVQDMVLKQFQLKQVLMVYPVRPCQFHNTLALVRIEIARFRSWACF